MKFGIIKAAITPNRDMKKILSILNLEIKGITSREKKLRNRLWKTILILVSWS